MASREQQPGLAAPLRLAPRFGPSHPPAAAAAPAVPSAPGWLLRPWVDLVFIANLGWPVLAIFAGTFSTTPAYHAFGFLLAYFVIMPHRWLTLPLVFFDGPRLAERRWAYLG